MTARLRELCEQENQRIILERDISLAHEAPQYLYPRFAPSVSGDPEEATQTLEQANPIREPPPSFNDDSIVAVDIQSVCGDGEFVPP